MYGMAGIGIAAAIGFVLILGSLGSTLLPEKPAVTTVSLPPGTTGPTTFIAASTQDIHKFASIDELRAYLSNIQNTSIFRDDFGSTLRFQAELSAPPVVTDSESVGAQAKTAEPAADYSTTNIQVAGVDEPDFIKNDGKYAYILSGSKLTIAEVFPADSAKILSKIGLDIQEGQYLQNMFLNGDKVVIFYQEYAEDQVISQYDFAPQPVYSPKTHALILDVSDRQDPKVFKNYSVSGSYSNARMIGDFVYLVTNSQIYNYASPIVPKIAESGRSVIVPDIYYFDNPEPDYMFNTVSSIDVTNSGDAVISKTYMMNPAATLYVSQDNIYIAYQKYNPYDSTKDSRDRFFEAVLPLLPADVQQKIRQIDSNNDLNSSEKWDQISTVLQDMYNSMSEQQKTDLIEKIQKALAEYDSNLQRDSVKTVIHKISIKQAGEFDYDTRGEVPGRLLNQFSMDEHDGKFRIATTTEYYTQYSSGLYNNIYVLDEDLKMAGKLEKVAPDESIYSARFLGDRLYLVTFQRTDPFFVIDLSSDQPKVLGQLKLPGFSNYLHPYDENHIIGIGRETVENEFGGVEVKGVKLALFDVSDVSKPRLVDQYEVGGPGTDSDVLYDHKALLFDREKNVLSIPVSAYDSQPRYEADGRYIAPKVWRGFYVFGLDAADGFDLKGKVEHFSSDYYYGGPANRSFYIDDVLYTVSLENLIKMNNIDTLQELGQLKIRSTGGIITYPEPYVK